MSLLVEMDRRAYPDDALNGLSATPQLLACTEAKLYLPG
jgi:hypothetical protein